MSFGGLVLTNSGRNELIRAEMGEKFNITHVVLGEGSYNGAYTAIKNIAGEVMQLPITRISRSGEEVLLECDFNSVDVPRAFYWREIGILANGVLCYYDNSREDAEYIDPDADVIVKQKRLRFVLLVSPDVEVNVKIESSLYALAADLEKVIYPEYVEAPELEEPGEKENIFQIFGKCKKAIKDLIAHLKNTDNPHEITKEQVGLGKADNTADMDKPVSAAQQEAIDAAKKQAGTALNDHTKDKSNPHGVTKAQVGLGNVDNTPDMGKPVSTAQQEALDEYYQQSSGYTDQKIAALINGAPSTLDTIGEIAQAMQNNAGVVEALEEAIGSKASEAEFDSHVKDKTAHITDAERKSWNDPAPTFTQASTRANIESGEKLSILMGKIKKIFSDLKTVAFSGSYTDLSNKPTSLKNPSALDIKLNGTSQGAYDGSSAKTVNITPGSIGAAPCSEVSNGDFNDMITPGLYMMSFTDKNAPDDSGSYYGLIVLNSDNDGYVEQIAFEENTYNLYIRYLYGEGHDWAAWKKITGLTPADIGALPVDGNAESASKWEKARNLGCTGDVVGDVSVDGSVSAYASVVRRGCVVGQSGGTASNPYYMFASATIKDAFSDLSITFHVTRGCYDNSTELGILTAHFRTDDSGAWESGELVWETAVSGIDTSKFKLAHYNSFYGCTASLWVVVDAPYIHIHFDVISECDRAVRGTKLWALRNESSAGSNASIPSAWKIIQDSTLAVIRNPVYDMRHIGNGTDGLFVNTVRGTIIGTRQQVFQVPTGGRIFVLLQFKIGSIFMPSSEIDTLHWDESGIVTLNKKYDDAYINWEFFIYYLLL